VTEPDASPPESELTGVVHRNIAALLEVRAQHERRKTVSDRVADWVAARAGSMASVAVHAAFFGGWIAVNVGLVPGVPRFDPQLVILAMAASVEAIFLSTFILISQNRLEVLSSKRADLDLQISLLAEHELTRLITLTDAVASHLGVPRPQEVASLEELERDVRPEAVLGEMERAEHRPGEDSVSRG
jgi:uncharacterized membrane protein